MEYQVKAVVPDKLVLEIDAFTRGYLECAEWCGLDEEGKEALELAVRPHWSGDALKEAIEVCKDFRDYETEGDLDESGLDDARAGHDFWLTRNRHGAGFWDEEPDNSEGDVLKRLTDRAHSYGSRSVQFVEETEELYFC